MKPTNETYIKFQELILKSEEKEICPPDTELGIQEGCSFCQEDITLERVLRALGVNISFTGRGNDKEIGIITSKHNKFEVETFYWILCQPAHLQSEETLLKLIELIK